MALVGTLAVPAVAAYSAAQAPASAGPTTVLRAARMIDPKSGPVVKIGAGSNGGAIGLTDGADRGVQIFAHDTGSLVRIVDRAGRERIVRP